MTWDSDVVFKNQARCANVDPVQVVTVVNIFYWWWSNKSEKLIL